MKNKLLLLLLLPLFLFQGCYTSKKSDNPPIPPPPKENATTVDFEGNGYRKAMMIDYSGVSGCGFLMQLEDLKKLQPKNLDNEFKKDSLNVWVKYVIEDAPNICMAGKVVRIIDIKKRPK